METYMDSMNFCTLHIFQGFQIVVLPKAIQPVSASSLGPGLFQSGGMGFLRRNHVEPSVSEIDREIDSMCVC